MGTNVPGWDQDRKRTLRRLIAETEQTIASNIEAACQSGAYDGWSPADIMAELSIQSELVVLKIRFGRMKQRHEELMARYEKRR